MSKNNIKIILKVTRTITEDLEVKTCPICGGIPKMIGERVECLSCGLAAQPQYWNNLSYAED